MGDADECRPSRRSDSLQELIEIIANVGIGGGCSKVCGLLPSSTLAGICGIVCEIVGIEEFAKVRCCERTCGCDLWFFA